MNTQHTPGPWSVNYTKFNEVKASNGALVATCNKLDGLVNLQANARLIAAAPELLAALKAIKERLEKSPTHVMYASEVFDSFYLSLINETIDKAEAA